MGTKTIRLDEDVYEKLRARKRDDETFSEAVDRLIGGPSLLEIAGILSEEEADDLDDAVEEFRSSLDDDLDRSAEEMT
jgi:predicted CopG family antitoxin